jgi:hypothetical protein
VRCELIPKRRLRNELLLRLSRDNRAGMLTYRRNPMKVVIGTTLAAVLLFGAYAAQPAQAQGWGSNSPRSGDWRGDEPRSGSDIRERCVGLHREARDLRIRLDREWNPVERMRTEGWLREVQDREARAGCR